MKDYSDTLIRDYRQEEAEEKAKRIFKYGCSLSISEIIDRNSDDFWHKYIYDPE